jgi:hypothetical protein
LLVELSHPRIPDSELPNGAAQHPGIGANLLPRTSKIRTSALVVPCFGTATKYRFSSGTKRAVLPSGPVVTFPSGL